MRILFLTPEVPHPPDSGGRLKTTTVLDYLRREHDVTVTCFRRRDLSGEQRRWAEETGVGIRSLVPSRNSLEQIFLDAVRGDHCANP